MRLLRSLPVQYPLLLELRDYPEFPLPQSLDIVKQIFEKLERPRGRNRECLMAYSRIRIEDAGRHIGEPVEIAGWLYNLRKSGKIVFPLLRDGTGIMQCVAVKASLDEATFEALKNLTQESSLIVRGKIRAESSARRAATRWTWKAPRSCSAFRSPIRIRSRPRNMASIF